VLLLLLLFLSASFAYWFANIALAGRLSKWYSINCSLNRFRSSKNCTDFNGFLTILRCPYVLIFRNAITVLLFFFDFCLPNKTFSVYNWWLKLLYTYIYFCMLALFVFCFFSWNCSLAGFVITLFDVLKNLWIIQCVFITKT